jgi:hypothetical protein
MDERLKKLLKSPLKAIKEFGNTDIEAGRYLSTYLSGYATIRRFYETRDEALEQGQESKRDETEGRRRAAVALVAAINSASDSIRGGLLDTNVDNVIPVDHLLVLLGEALAFVNRKRLQHAVWLHSTDILFQGLHKFSHSNK